MSDVEALAETLSDTLLSFGADAREVGVLVHALISANKSIDAGLASDAADGMEFYAGHGRSAARTRAKAKAAATTTPSK